MHVWRETAFLCYCIYLCVTLEIVLEKGSQISEWDDSTPYIRDVGICQEKAASSQVNETANATPPSEDSGTTKDPRLTGDPQKDYIYDPNLPRELNGYDLSNYPFYTAVPNDITFKCDGRHDGYYASVPHHCQLFHLCVHSLRHDFLCANYTVFDQTQFICHFVNSVNCSNSETYYERNEELYVTTTTTEAPLEYDDLEYEDATTPPPKRRRRPRPKRRRGKGRRPGKGRRTTTTTTTAPPEDYYYDYEDETPASAPAKNVQEEDLLDAPPPDDESGAEVVPEEPAKPARKRTTTTVPPPPTAPKIRVPRPKLRPTRPVTEASPIPPPHPSPPPPPPLPEETGDARPESTLNEPEVTAAEHAEAPNDFRPVDPMSVVAGILSGIGHAPRTEAPAPPRGNRPAGGAARTRDSHAQPTRQQAKPRQPVDAPMEDTASSLPADALPPQRVPQPSRGQVRNQNQAAPVPRHQIHQEEMDTLQQPSRVSGSRASGTRQKLTTSPPDPPPSEVLPPEEEVDGGSAPSSTESRGHGRGAPVPPAGKVRVIQRRRKLNRSMAAATTKTTTTTTTTTTISPAEIEYEYVE